MGNAWPGDPLYCPICERHPSAHDPECVVDRLRILIEIAIAVISAGDMPRTADMMRQRMDEILEVE